MLLCEIPPAHSHNRNAKVIFVTHQCTKVSLHVFHAASNKLSLKRCLGRQVLQCWPQLSGSLQVTHLLGEATKPDELTMANLSKPGSALGTVGAVSTTEARLHGIGRWEEFH